RHAQLPIQPENPSQVPLQIAYVIADAADPELAKVRQVLSNLCRVQMKLLRERLGRDGAHPSVFELIEAPQVHRKSIRRELRHLVDDLLRLGHASGRTRVSGSVAEPASAVH